MFTLHVLLDFFYRPLYCFHLTFHMSNSIITPLPVLQRQGGLCSEKGHTLDVEWITGLVTQTMYPFLNLYSLRRSTASSHTTTYPHWSCFINLVICSPSILFCRLLILLLPSVAFPLFFSSQYSLAISHLSFCRSATPSRTIRPPHVTFPVPLIHSRHVHSRLLVLWLQDWYTTHPSCNTTPNSVDTHICFLLHSSSQFSLYYSHLCQISAL